jgi:hypothetical protein
LAHHSIKQAQAVPHRALASPLSLPTSAGTGSHPLLATASRCTLTGSLGIIDAALGTAQPTAGSKSAVGPLPGRSGGVRGGHSRHTSYTPLGPPRQVTGPTTTAPLPTLAPHPPGLRHSAASQSCQRTVAATQQAQWPRTCAEYRSCGQSSRMETPPAGVENITRYPPKRYSSEQNSAVAISRSSSCSQALHMPDACS